VEGLFSSSKDVSRSQNMQEMPLNPGHLLFIAKGYTASRYRMTQCETCWPDAPIRVTGRVRSLQDKREPCASEVAVAVTRRDTPIDRARYTWRPIGVQRAPRAIGRIQLHVTGRAAPGVRSESSKGLLTTGRVCERIMMPKRGVNWAFLKINCKN
jgi:hypothetical protein